LQQKRVKGWFINYSANQKVRYIRASEIMIRDRKIFILFLCLLCFAVYFNSLSNNFILDDNILIVKNPIIKSVKLFPLILKGNVSEYSSLITRPYNKMYRPLQLLSYAIDYKIWKLNPLGFHIINVAIHLFNSILVYYLLLIIFNNIQVSWIVSIIFLVHPIHTSVVSYISSRADLFVYFFMLLSMISFLKFIKERINLYYVISLLFALFALFSRENALILFIFLALLLSVTKARASDYLYILPFVLLSLLYILLRFIIFGPNALTLHYSFMPFFFRVVNLLNIIPRFLFLLIFPLNLHLFRTTPFITHLLDKNMLLVMPFVLFLIIIFMKFYKNKIIMFCMLWFLIGMIPVFTILDNYYELNEAMMAESWLYIPSLGFFVAFIYILEKISKKIGIILIISSVVFYSFLTWVNNAYWKNEGVFYRNILENTSERNYLRINLINYYLTCGAYEKALIEIKKLSLYYPDTPYLYYIWGNYYLAVGQINEAIDSFNKVLTINKNYYIAYYHLCVCYTKLGQLEKAIYSALECFKINPYYLDNLIGLGDLYVKKGQLSDAKKYYYKALEIGADGQLIKEKLKNAE